MPTIKANRRVIDRIIGEKLSDERLKDRISMLGTDLEELGKDEIVVEIFPNRPDMLSEQGFGRALSSFIGARKGLKEYKVKPSGEKVIIDRSMKGIRPYTACAIIKNLKLDDEKIKEIIDIQEKLHITFCRNRKKAAMGIYPMDKVEFPITLKSKPPKDIVFRPLEWPEPIDATQILSKHPTGREYAHLVDGLKRFAIFEDGKGDILSFTPIINSHLTGRITEKTREAFFEVSGFDFRTCEMILNIVVSTLADMGADIYSLELVYPDHKKVTPDLEPRKMKLDPGYVNRHLGFDLKETELKELLEMMGHTYKQGYVYYPAYRADVMHPIDFTEDIAIAYGYENIEEEIPKIMTIGQESRTTQLRNKIADILVGLGLLEANTLHLINSEKQTKWMNDEKPVIEILKSVSKEHDSVRRSILPVFLEILASNKHNEYPQKLFTMGRVFDFDSSTETNCKEDLHLSVVTTHREADYTEIRQFLDYLFSKIDIDVNLHECEHPSFIPGRVAEVRLGRQKLGYLGEVHPQVLENFELSMPVAALEIDLEPVKNKL